MQSMFGLLITQHSHAAKSYGKALHKCEQFVTRTLLACRSKVNNTTYYDQGAL